MKFLLSYPRGNDTFDTFYTSKVMDRLLPLADEVAYNDCGRPFTKDEWKQAVKGVDIVFTGWGALPFDEEIMACADKLKMVVHVGGSIALLLSEDGALEKRNIPILSGNKVFAQSVAEGAVLYMLAAGRHFIKINQQMMNDGWSKYDTNVWGLRGKKIGLVGFGEIAKDVVPLLKAFCVDEILVYSEYLKQDAADAYGVRVSSLDEIFSTCDFVSVHSGLNDQNYHLVKGEHMRKMKKNGVIVNTARGPVIDEDALAEVLAERPDMRAAIDVYSVEPLPMDAPIRKLENAILLPHQGGPTLDYRELVTLAVLDDVEKFLQGKDDFEHIVTYEQGKRMTNEGLRNKKK